jgi:hypothetical protein
LFFLFLNDSSPYGEDVNIVIFLHENLQSTFDTKEVYTNEISIYILYIRGGNDD